MRAVVCIYSFCICVLCLLSLGCILQPCRIQRLYIDCIPAQHSAVARYTIDRSAAADSTTHTLLDPPSPGSMVLSISPPPRSPSLPPTHPLHRLLGMGVEGGRRRGGGLGGGVTEQAPHDDRQAGRKVRQPTLTESSSPWTNHTRQQWA